MRYTKQIFIMLSLFVIATSFKITVDNTQQEVIEVSSIAELKTYINVDSVKVKLAAGNYQIDDAKKIRFLEFTGNNTHFDLKGARFMVDTKLFSRKDLESSNDGNDMYCVIEVSGKNVMLEGLYIETYGDTPGKQSKNKIFNVVGEDVTLKNIEIRTAGSSPWGYGSLYGLGGGDVRKMNGIRVGYPAKNAKLIGCKVHMRAMGHAIFLQGSENTLIEDCHVDGLLRTTNAILKETSGYMFDKGFYATKPKHKHKPGYVEGTIIGLDGKILPGEIISLSEDGIRMYPEYNGHKTLNTTVKNCTVTQMRRGICTGLSTSGDKIIDCVVRDCVATGYNIGNADTVINCSADAKYAEAFCVPYTDAKGAHVEMTILDSRGGLANNLLAKINGSGHEIIIKTADPDYIPENLEIKLSVWESYGNFSKDAVMHVTDIKLENQTNTKVLLYPGTKNPQIESVGEVVKVPSRE
ncbi:hypothetical protein [Maribacter forsetii]|uniref:hypothetical protein n=1 Tax=Maribacter forsetii TaxID=444515 RepID=UPI0012FB3A08|nr:hypothetical protein [Maribacter forsetii]